MDAGSLADLCAKHAPSGGMKDEREMGKIATQMLNGLHYLHRQHHQVHRDLKPANVMLNSSGAVKISDFGISSQLDSTAAMCSTFVGTTCFMSPERLAGDPYSYSSDVWSFGLIMLELASGKYPYSTDDQSYFKLLGMIMDNPPPSLPEGICSDAFAEFISLCLEKDAARRPAAKLLLKHPWLRECATLPAPRQRAHPPPCRRARPLPRHPPSHVRAHSARTSVQEQTQRVAAVWDAGGHEPRLNRALRCTGADALLILFRCSSPTWVPGALSVPPQLWRLGSVWCPSGARGQRQQPHEQYHASVRRRRRGGAPLCQILEVSMPAGAYPLVGDGYACRLQQLIQCTACI